MISGLFHLFFYNPIYNGLVFFIDVVPFGDVGIAIIAITCIVKLILFPLSKKAVRTQMVMKKLEPELQAIKEKYAQDKQQQAQKMMALHRENNIHPLSSLLLIFIQMPIIIALYWVFYRGGLPEINVDILYSFIPNPSGINMNFLGFIDMSSRSLLLAVLAGITQYFQINLSLPPLAERKEKPSLKEDLARSFHLQMKYIMPIFISVIAYVISAAVALYWLTSNMFAIGQEFVIRKQVKEKFK